MSATGRSAGVSPVSLCVVALATIAASTLTLVGRAATSDHARPASTHVSVSHRATPALPHATRVGQAVLTAPSSSAMRTAATRPTAVAPSVTVHFRVEADPTVPYQEVPIAVATCDVRVPYGSSGIVVITHAPKSCVSSYQLRGPRIVCINKLCERPSSSLPLLAWLVYENHKQFQDFGGLTDFHARDGSTLEARYANLMLD